MPSTTIAIGELVREPRATEARDGDAVLVLILEVPPNPDRPTDEPIRYNVKATGPVARHAAAQLERGDHVLVMGTARHERYRPQPDKPTDTVLWLVADVIGKVVSTPPRPAPPTPQRLTLVRPTHRAAPNRPSRDRAIAPAV